jgi:cytochrome c oxidase subunit 2
MKMSNGQIGRRLLGLAVAGVALATCGTALAELGQPAPWEYTLQESASPVMDTIIWFHNFLFVLITVITLFVLALLVIVVVKFNARANPVPSRTTHNTLIEVAWTLIPVLILVGIAVPSFRLLFEELDIPKADLTIKASSGTGATPIPTTASSNSIRCWPRTSSPGCSASTTKWWCRSTR